MHPAPPGLSSCRSPSADTSVGYQAPEELAAASGIPPAVALSAGWNCKEGKRSADETKSRPVVISFLNQWKKEHIMKNKKKMETIYLTDDYPKNVLEKRKILQEQLMEERKKGNYAIIKYDSLIIRDNTHKNEKRKREKSISPREQQLHKHHGNLTQ
ncbi:unnamed protein product [Leptidea sinapis]|uniref:Uncharacterized protein n=1 Tax=Leptidea sinapis TaxID=189913 RepID=A0A5E4QGA0_9NEOP|nr:unnamed protein product [Leptidea sinapis]